MTGGLHGCEGTASIGASGTGPSGGEPAVAAVRYILSIGYELKRIARVCSIPNPMDASTEGSVTEEDEVESVLSDSEVSTFSSITRTDGDPGVA